MVLTSKLILAIGAHPDDIELGCGGSINSLSSQGGRVVALFLSKGEKSGNPEQRVKESKTALSILGIEDVFFGDFPDTEIPDSHRAIAFIESYIEKYNPDTVLTHTIHDTHQDHRQVGWLSLSASRNVPRLLAYETPRVTSGFLPSYFVDISDCVERKWIALQCHKSQKDKRYLAYESMVRLSSFRGNMVNLPAAEAFEVIRYVETKI